jgi:hypothetical protein
MTYTPKEGSYAAKVIGYLEQLPMDTWITSKDVAAMFGVQPKQVVGLLDYACAAGVLDKTLTPVGMAFRLGTEHVPGQQQAEEARRLVASELRDLLAVEEIDIWPVQRAWRPAKGLPMPETFAAPSVFHLGAML